MGGRGYKLFKYLNVIVISNYDSLKSQRNFCHADAGFWRGVPLEITLLLRCSVTMMASFADAVEMLPKRYCWSGTAEEN